MIRYMVDWKFGIVINTGTDVLHFYEDGEIVCTNFKDPSVEKLLYKKVCRKIYRKYSANNIKDFRENITALKNKYEGRINICDDCVIYFYG